MGACGGVVGSSAINAPPFLLRISADQLDCCRQLKLLLHMLSPSFSLPDQKFLQIDENLFQTGAGPLRTALRAHIARCRPKGSCRACSASCKTKQALSLHGPPREPGIEVLSLHLRSSVPHCFHFFFREADFAIRRANQNSIAFFEFAFEHFQSQNISDLFLHYPL